MRHTKSVLFRLASKSRIESANDLIVGQRSGQIGHLVAQGVAYRTARTIVLGRRHHQIPHDQREGSSVAWLHARYLAEAAGKPKGWRQDRVQSYFFPHRRTEA
jgi:hypothetical protein